jgi:DNA-binding response OmpR family regulator
VRESFRVLVIDDDPGVRDYVEALGVRRGWRTFVATGGEEALGGLGETRPDVITLDMMLPGIDGLETLRRLKEVRPDLPVIMVSGQERLVTADRARALGASDFLCKPFAAEDLEAALRAALGLLPPPASIGEEPPQA